MRFSTQVAIFFFSWLSSSAAAWVVVSPSTTATTTANTCSEPYTALNRSRRRATPTLLPLAKAGTFFNPVPNDDNDDDDTKEDDDNNNNNNSNDEPTFESSIEELLRTRKAPPRASEPSTISGVPTSQAGVGFGKTNPKKTPPQKFVAKKPFVGIGPPLNDVTKPEVDDQGYTLYADEVTGKKSRVFEALVEYPCDFTMKIVGANEGSFVQEMVAVVAESCHVAPEQVPHSIKQLGKWTSVTVQAPVQSAEMLYALYENVDRDPRVKFKF